MSQECEMPQPGPEHAKILEGVGTWDVSCKYFMEPGAPPLESKAVDTVTALGGFWTVGRFVGEFMGQPFYGMSSMGYDPMTKKYRTTWIDSISPAIFILDGEFDGSGKVLKTAGKGPDMQGGMTDYRMESDYRSKNEMVMRMFISMGGQDCLMMEHTYRRRK